MRVFCFLAACLAAATAAIIQTPPPEDETLKSRVIHIEGQGAEIQLGEDGELSCTAYTDQQPTAVFWERVDPESRKTGESGPPSPQDHQETWRPWTWTLKFVSVSAADDGVYRCTIKTLSGEQVSADVLLEVEKKPIVQTYEDAKTISCSATSLPESQVWLEGVTSPQTISSILNDDGTWTSTATVTFAHLEQPIGPIVTCMVKYKDQIMKFPFERPAGHADGLPLDPEYFLPEEDK